MVRGRNPRDQIKAIKTKDGSSKVSYSDLGISKLPDSPGVYAFGCNGQTSYIGSSGDVKRRVKQHKQNGTDACYVKYIPTKTRKGAYDLERNLIGKSCPPDNRIKPGKCKSIWEQWGF